MVTCLNEFLDIFSARFGYYVLKKETGGRQIMLLFSTLNYRRNVWSGILNGPLSLHQRTLDE